MIDLAEKFGISLSKVTAAHSPFSNGICERNHQIVDLMMAKIKAADPTISHQESLDYALHAKNMEMTNKGFSPFQIVYGENPRIPGISTGNLASLSNQFSSEDVKKHIWKVQTARDALGQLTMTKGSKSVSRREYNIQTMNIFSLGIKFSLRRMKK